MGIVVPFKKDADSSEFVISMFCWKFQSSVYDQSNKQYTVTYIHLRTGERRTFACTVYQFFGLPVHSNDIERLSRSCQD